jgi:rhodanese-related sulfurtransferase
MKPLGVAEVKEAMGKDAVVLDTRHATVFTQGFIPGSIFVGLEGRFAEWAGSMLPFDKEMILVTEPGKEKETIVRLARVGFSKVVGYVSGGFEAWKAAGEEIDLIIDIEADEFAMDLPFDENILVLDVRKPTEFADGHVKDATNLPLNEMNNIVEISNLEEDQNIYVHCAGGYRSVIAASLLKRQGIHNLRNVLGGWSKIKEQEKIKKEKEQSVLN